MKYFALITLGLLVVILKANAGKCPAPIVGRSCKECQDECKDDTQCPNGQSCCSESCGNICRPTPKKGVRGRPSAKDYSCNCPAPLGEACAQQVGNGCKDFCGPEAPCQNGKVCCSEYCGNRCRDPSQTKEGEKANGPRCPRAYKK